MKFDVFSSLSLTSIDLFEYEGTRLRNLTRGGPKDTHRRMRNSHRGLRLSIVVFSVTVAVTKGRR